MATVMHLIVVPKPALPYGRDNKWYYRCGAELGGGTSDLRAVNCTACLRLAQEAPVLRFDSPFPEGGAVVIPRGDFGDGVFPDWLEARFQEEQADANLFDPREALLVPLSGGNVEEAIKAADALLAHVDRCSFDYGCSVLSFCASPPGNSRVWRVRVLSDS